MGYLAFMHLACFYALLIFIIQTNASIEIILLSVSP